MCSLKFVTMAEIFVADYMGAIQIPLILQRAREPETTNFDPIQESRPNSSCHESKCKWRMTTNPLRLTISSFR